MITNQEFKCEHMEDFHSCSKISITCDNRTTNLICPFVQLNYVDIAKKICKEYKPVTEEKWGLFAYKHAPYGIYEKRFRDLIDDNDKFIRVEQYYVKPDEISIMIAGPFDTESEAIGAMTDIMDNVEARKIKE